MIVRISRVLLSVSAILVGIYPAIYFIIDREFGLLQSKSDAVLTDVFWNIGFYTHIILGGIALLIGWIQFSAKFRNAHLKWHRRIGKLYVTSVLFSSIAAIYISFYAMGGMIASLGFFCLGLFWLATTSRAYIAIRDKQKLLHQKLMIYSYAACFAAVTLRIYLPLLIMLLQDGIKAYLVVAWLSWVPNIIVAYFLVRRLEKIKHESSSMQISSG